MKKTLIALMVLTGVSLGSESMEWSGSNYDLSNSTTVAADTIGNTDGWIITKTNGNTSPAPVILTLHFTITALPGTVDQNLISFAADGGEASNAYGFTIKTNGTLEFGRTNTNKLSSTTDAVTTTTTTVIGSLTLNTEYTLTLVSKAIGTDPGRGTGNFDITLVNSSTNTTIEKKGDGFGLNGSNFGSLYIGSAISDDTTVLKGTISSVSVASPTIPEPTTATLSLLALAGLAARRRR